MLLRPTPDDVRVITRTTGQALTWLGVGTLGLAFLGLMARDVDDASALAIGGALGVIAGTVAQALGRSDEPLSWTRGVVAAVFSWIGCSLVGAVPLYLSGHYRGFFDATFDAMSGLTTTGLTLVQDLDHLPVLFVLYRHGLELAGGLAIVVVGLTLLTATTATASSLQPGDVRDERILPNPGRTWRQVGVIATGVVGGGAVVATIAVALAGVRGAHVLVHGVTLAVSAATTGGFAPTSASVGYYHSPLVEWMLVPLMIAGATSYAIHVAAWRGARSRLSREFELRTFLATLGVVLVTVLVGLARSGAQTGFGGLFRRGVFSAVSAQTTTGLTVVPPRLLAIDWGLLAPAALVAAMTIGGMTGSTAGGLKVLRVGAVMKGVVNDVRRVLLPESTLLAPTFTAGRRRILTDAHVRSAATLLLIVLTATLTGAVLVLYVDGNANLTEALFLSTSAATNGGMPIGTLGTFSPVLLKATLLTLMLLGRLEWLAVFATVGFLYAGIRGRR